MTRLTGADLKRLFDQALAESDDPEALKREHDELLLRYRGDMDALAAAMHRQALLDKLKSQIAPPAYETTKAEDMKALRYLIRRYPAEAAELLRRLSPSPGVASPSCGAGEATPNQT